MITRQKQRVFHCAVRRLRDERGDVPGWVLVTIMTAGLVAVLWPFAEQYLQQILESALDLVSP